MKKTKTLRLSMAVWLAWLAGHPYLCAQTWWGTSAPTDVQWVSVASSADGTKLVAAGGYPTWSVYVSANGGASWTETTRNIGFSCIACSADGTKVVGGQSDVASIFTSTNSGVTFTQAASPQCNWIYLTSSADGTKLAAVGQVQPAPAQIYASSDSGNTWALTSAPATNWSGLASSADGSRLVADVGGNGSFYTSTDAGTNWTQQTNEPALWWGALASSANGMKLAAVTIGGDIWTSTNGGTNWTEQTNAPSQVWSTIASSADGTKLVAAVRSGFGAGAPGPIYTSADSGVTWVSNNMVPEWWSSVASSADGSNLVACSGNLTNGSLAPSQIATSMPHPWLTAEFDGTNADLTWPWPMEGYRLQQKPRVAATTWTDVTNVPVVTNLQYQVIVPPLAGEGYFRLSSK